MFCLSSGDDSGLFKENNKVFEVGTGSLELKVTSVNAELGEIGGVFVQKQPSDTDLGSKAPKEVSNPFRSCLHVLKVFASCQSNALAVASQMLSLLQAPCLIFLFASPIGAP